MEDEQIKNANIMDDVPGRSKQFFPVSFELAVINGHTHPFLDLNTQDQAEPSQENPFLVENTGRVFIFFLKDQIQPMQDSLLFATPIREVHGTEKKMFKKEGLMGIRYISMNEDLLRIHQLLQNGNLWSRGPKFWEELGLDGNLMFNLRQQAYEHLSAGRPDAGYALSRRLLALIIEALRPGAMELCSPTLESSSSSQESTGSGAAPVEGQETDFFVIFHPYHTDGESAPSTTSESTNSSDSAQPEPAATPATANPATTPTTTDPANKGKGDALAMPYSPINFLATDSAGNPIDFKTEEGELAAKLATATLLDSNSSASGARPSPSDAVPGPSGIPTTLQGQQDMLDGVQFMCQFGYCTDDVTSPFYWSEENLRQPSSAGTTKQGSAADEPMPEWARQVLFHQAAEEAKKRVAAGKGKGKGKKQAGWVFERRAWRGVREAVCGVQAIRDRYGERVMKAAVILYVAPKGYELEHADELFDEWVRWGYDKVPVD